MNDFAVWCAMVAITFIITLAAISFSQWVEYKKMALKFPAYELDDLELDPELVAYDKGRRDGMEEAATYLETRFIDRDPLAKAIRTLKDNGDPCEDCGFPLPVHDASCVSRNEKL